MITQLSLMDVIPLPQTWIREVDLLRGFAILAVVVIHVSSIYWVTEINGIVAVDTILYNFSLFAVPLFILISGLVSSRKYWECFSVKSFYHKRLESIIPPYFVFSVFFIAMMAFLNRQLTSPSDIIFDILSGNSYFHLWFVALIIQLYLAYPVIQKVYKYFDQRGLSYLLLLILLVVQLLWMLILLQLGIKDLSIRVYDIGYTVIQRAFISYIFYFVLGIYVGRNLEKISTSLNSLRTKGFVIVSFIMTSTITAYFLIGISSYGGWTKIPPFYISIEKVILPLYYLITFIILYKISHSLLVKKNIIKGIIENIGYYSFGIFLVHPFPMRIITFFLRGWISLKTI